MYQKATGSSEEENGTGNHSVHPQLLPPFDPHESHDDHVEDVLGTLAEFKGSLVRGEGARSMESGDDRLSAVVELELVGHV